MGTVGSDSSRVVRGGQVQDGCSPQFSYESSSPRLGSRSLEHGHHCCCHRHHQDITATVTSTSTVITVVVTATTRTAQPLSPPPPLSSLLLSLPPPGLHSHCHLHHHHLPLHHHHHHQGIKRVLMIVSCDLSSLPRSVETKVTELPLPGP